MIGLKYIKVLVYNLKMTKDEVLKAIRDLIQSNFDSKRDRDSRNEKILAMFKEGFDLSEPDTARKITSMMLQQSMWRVMNKSKPLDFQLHGNSASESEEQVMTYSISTVANKSQYVDILRGKQGIFWNQFMFGDAFYMMGTDNNGKFPIQYSIIPNSNFYVDQFATAIRTTEGRSATECLAIFSMDTEVAWNLYPSLKKNKIVGQIPREINRVANVETGRGNNQSWKIQGDITEVGYYYNIKDRKNPIHAIIAGNNVFLIDKYEGAKYPFYLDKDAYIPIGQFMCMPSAQGFYNYGIGDLLYRIAVVNRRLLNMAIGHAEDSVYPVTLLNVAQGTAGQFFQSLQEALKGRTAGLKPIVPIEYDPANPNANRIAAQSLITQSSMGEFTTIKEILDREIRRCGINLDDIENGPNVTATQIIAEEENSNAWIKQIHEYNASEQEFALKVMLDLSKKFIKGKDSTPIDMPVKVNLGVDPADGQKLMGRGNWTLGGYAEKLRKGHWYIKVNSRTGSIPSNVMKQAQISRVLPLVPQGSPAYNDLIQRVAQLNDVDVDTSGMTPPPTPGGPAGTETPETPIPTENDRLTFKPRDKGQVAAM